MEGTGDGRENEPASTVRRKGEKPKSKRDKSAARPHLPLFDPHRTRDDIIREFELEKKGNTTSLAWNHFMVSTRVEYLGWAFCMNCGGSVSDSSPKNLSDHLQGPCASPAKSVSRAAAARISQDTEQRKKLKPEDPSPQPALDSLVQRMSKDRAKQITESLVTNLVGIDMVPISIVEKIGFRLFIRDLLGPHYVLPSRATVRRLLLQKASLIKGTRMDFVGS